MTDVMEGMGTQTGVATGQGAEMASRSTAAPVFPPATGAPAPENQPVLCAPRQALADLMAEIGFGRIDCLHVRDGEPVFDPGSNGAKLHVFGKPGNRPPSRPREDWRAKRMGELFGIFDSDGTLVLDELIVNNGLPVRVTLRDGLGV